MQMIDAVSKPTPKLSENIVPTEINYLRKQIIEKALAEPVDVTFEPDLYTQADMSAAAIAVMEDIRHLLPEDKDETSVKILEAIKEENKIDHLNR
jgi:hypothetical protein